MSLYRREHRLLALVAVCAALLLLAPSPAAGYDLLALQQDWPPNSCAADGNCARGPYGVFTIWGLYPTNIETDDPVKCNGPAFNPASVPEGVLQQMQCIFMNNAGSDYQLWSDQWSIAGTCSGLSQEQYWSFLTTAYSQYNMNVILSNASVQAGSIDRNALLDAVESVTGKKAWLVCNTTTRSVTFISLCFDSKSPLTPTLVDCPWDRQDKDTRWGAECNGPVNLLQTGQAPPQECMQYFETTIPGAVLSVAPSPSPNPSQSLSPSLPSPDPSPSPVSGNSPGSPAGGPAPPQPGDSSSSGGSSIGPIIGATVGGVLVAGAAAAGFVMWRRRRARRTDQQNAELPKPGAELPATLPPGSGLEDSFIDMTVSSPPPPVHPSSVGVAAVVGSGASSSMQPASPVMYHAAAGAAGAAGAVAHSTGSAGPRAQLSRSSQGAGTGTPTQGSLLPPDHYSTFGGYPYPPLTARGGSPANPPAANGVGMTDAGASPSASPAPSTPSIEQDPLLSYVQSQLHSVPALNARGRSASTPSSRGLSATSTAFWSIPFSELTIIRPIGQGSFGRVYQAEWHSTAVAVKLLIGDPAQEQQDGLSMSSPLLTKLEGEAELMLALRHPNCCSILGVCETPPCLVTEYCERGSVTECLRAARTDPAVEAQLTWERRLSMALDAAKGMIYLHTRNPPVIHRDMKSPNLLVDSSWRVKVSDFNLSKFADASTRSSSLAAMNPRWLAPEIMEGQHASLASDVFGYACVLWELLTWELPWANTNPWQMVSLVVHGGRLPIPPADELPGTDRLPPELLSNYIALIQACWAQNPLDRPTFQQVIGQLRSIQDRLLGSAPAAD